MEISESNTQEKWIKHNSVDIPKGSYFVTDFSQNADGVRIILDDEKNIVEIYFNGVPSITRISVEGIRMRTCREVLKKYDDEYFFRNCFLFMIENSDLSKWAAEESCGFYEAEKLKHYCIVTMEEVIDILATFEPKISVSHI